ncbi:MAG TPA: GNAT family N-acetyltransferase [Sphingomonas sp.]|nr:GNAT family N-acetyltransferase [Sphingomonas sp.]
MTAEIAILDYADDLAPAFHAINAAWIGEMFTIEPHDAHVLAHPREAIVDAGGVILFARHPELGVIGTGALMPTAPGALELTKMGVLATARGTGAGRALLAALIERARALAPDTFYLLTNSKCAAAIHLYEAAGFVHDAGIMARFGATYARCDVAMRYRL